MIPEHPKFRLDARLPNQAAYWRPSADDIGDEGFGGYHSTWYLAPDLTEAADVMRAEVTLVDLLDAAIESADDFETAAYAVEIRDPDGLPSVIGAADRLVLEPYLDEDDVHLLGCLEVGVAGLSYALSAVGCLTAASCRGHQIRSWSDYPKVVFAADRRRARLLAPLAYRTGCGFSVDGWGGELLAVGAPSIRHLMALADELLARSSDFGEPELPPPSPHDQLGLDL